MDQPKSAGRPPAIAEIQEMWHGEGYDYEQGSPHLSHPALRNKVLSRIRSLVDSQFRKQGHCRVLEVGAGHGAFTDHVLAMGAEVTITEMSRPSLDLLSRRFAHNPNATLIYDPEGEVVFGTDAKYDFVLCVSVLHHIPDYETFVRRAIGLLNPGGAFASFQDPLWYPRRGALDRGFDRGTYFLWRLRQGNISRGVATRLRRLRGVYDDTNPADMVEYHVVRQGVDEQLLKETMEKSFADVELWRYFSTQGKWLQSIGARVAPPTTFALVASDYSPVVL